MFQRKDKRIFVGAMVAVLFLALAAGIAISIQPASAQAPLALPGGAPQVKNAPARISGAKRVAGSNSSKQVSVPSTSSGKPAGTNHSANVPALQGQFTQPDRGSAPARIENIILPEHQIDLAQLGVHPISRDQVPP